MILVPSHPQPLNGNKFLLVACFFAMLFGSCAVSKKSNTDSNVQIIKGETGPKTPIKDEAKRDPSAETAQKKALKTDTLAWRDVSSLFPPVKNVKKIKDTQDHFQSENIKQEFKDEYNITLLLPLDSDMGSLPSDTRFIQFYAGTLLALEGLYNEGIKFNTKVIDTKEGNFNIQDKSEEILNQDPDLIIGPYERDDIKTLVDACKKAGVPLVSPWQTSTKIALKNPYYIQIKPNLKDHFKKLAETTTLDYKKGEVAIIINDENISAPWVSYFQQNALTFTGEDGFFIPYFVNQDSIKKGKNVFSKLLTSGIKAFIFPSYDYTDEEYINQCLKKLAVEKGHKSIEVFGMPVIFESTIIDFDNYQALNINVVVSEEGGQHSSEIQKFKKDYLQKYGDIPEYEAIRAYDIMTYLGRSLWKYGKTFQYQLWQETDQYINSRFNVVKTIADDLKSGTDNYTSFDYFENKHLNILKFKDNTWQIRY